MAKIVYNACFGGFGLSDAAMHRYAELKGITLYPENTKYGLTTYWVVPPEQRNEGLISPEDWFSASFDERAESNRKHRERCIHDSDIPRTDPALVQTVEELGAAANGPYAELRVAEVPSGTLYRIDEYDGNESVETKDTYDWSVA